MPRGTLWLTSATNPENGTVSYTYNADGTLAGKTDANGNTETCNYGAQRLISIPDRQQTFAYDTCPAGATGCVSAPGQLMQAAFGSNVGPDELSFAYNYAYTPASKVSSKTMVVMSSWYWGDAGADPSSASLAVNYTYDNQGALTSLQVPLSFPYSPVVFTYTLDAMERPTGDSNRVSGVTYNAANQMLFDGVRTWTYNNLLQATSVSGTGMSMTYNYSANKNNGQITSSVDAGITPNETITYTYDALKRLVAADGLNWTESYVYDGFGNLTQMNPTGGAPTLSVSVALDQNNVPNNRILASGVTYDNNGNLTLGFGNIGPAYDAANRVSQVRMNGQPNTYYGYDPDNRRVYSGGTGHGADTIYLYGVDGKKLATYTTSFTGTYPWYTMNLNNQSYNEYFGGRLVSAEGNLVRTDRLDSVRSGGPGGLGYQAQYPYGVEYTTTANDREKYATYTRDSLTGFDYAVNRYYSSQWGRFLSPDPYGGSADPSSPQSWNRYQYAANDPANHADPTGLLFTAQDCINDPDACVASDNGWGELGSPGVDGLPCGFGYGTVCGILDPGLVCIAVPQGSSLAPMPPVPTPEPCGPPPPPPPPPAPSFFELEEIGACAYPHGVGITKITGMFTLDVTYQLLENNQPIFGNSTLNKLGASVFESVTVTSGKSISADGQWCPAGSSLCATPGSMSPFGQFDDLLAANPSGPSTATQVFSLYEKGGPYTLPVINFPGSPTVLQNTYSSTSISVGSGAVIGNLGTALCPGVQRPIRRPHHF